MDDWIFIGGDRTSSFSDSRLSRHESHSILLLKSNIDIYNIDTDDILALGTNCYHCGSNRERKFLYYMFNEQTRELRVFGTACAKSILGIRKKCRSCGELYDYILNSCDKCDNRTINIGVYKLTYKEATSDRNHYKAFCYSQIYGNINSRFSRYLISNGFFEKPTISYEYYTEGDYKNSSIYHVYLFIKGEPCYGPIPDEDLGWLNVKLTKRCFVCDKDFKEFQCFRIKRLCETLYVCSSCKETNYTICGIEIVLGEILRGYDHIEYLYIQNALLVGYFYANDDKLASIIGRRFGLYRDLAIDENPDINIYLINNSTCQNEKSILSEIDLSEERLGSKIDKVKYITCELFEYEFDSIDRDIIRDIINSKCDICHYSYKLKSPSRLLTRCRCDESFDFNICELQIFKGSFRELIQNKSICLILLSSHKSSSEISDTWLELLFSMFKDKIKIYEDDIRLSIVYVNNLCFGELSISALIEYDIKMLFEVFENQILLSEIRYALHNNIFKHRKIVKQLTSMIGIGDKIREIIKQLGKRTIKKPFKRMQYSSACNSKKPNQLNEAIRTGSREIFDKNPGLLEYYAFVKNLTELP